MKNKLKFYYNGEILFESNYSGNIEELNDIQVSKIFKTAIKRRKLNGCNDWQEYLIKLGFEFNKCNFCGNNASSTIKIHKDKNNVSIINLQFRLNYCNNYLKTCPGSKLNPNSVAFVSKAFNLSDENALKYIKERNKSPFYKENHKTDEEYKSAQTRDINYYINKYGEKDGTKRYNEYSKKLKYSHSEQHYIDLLGEIKGKEHWLYLSTLKDSMSYDYCLKKCNNNIEEAKKLYEERLHSVNIGLSRMIERYGEIQGKIVHDKIKDNAKLTWKKHYLKNKDNIQNVTFYNGVSKQSILFFDEITKILLENNIIDSIENVQYGIKNEKAIYNEISQTCYFYDFFIKKLKLIIEYNGIKWHPKSIDDINFSHPYDKINNSTYYYNKDVHKLNTAKKYGYNVIVIWEDDTDKINTCIEEIKKIIKYE